MSLSKAEATDRVVFLGITAEYKYNAGEYEGRAFGAGTVRRICVGSIDGDTQDYNILKVRNEACVKYRELFASLRRGEVVTITHVRFGQDYELRSIAQGE